MAQGRQDEAEDLKRREYRDAKGEIHHHTHAYMERHGAGSEGEAKPTRSTRFTGAKAVAAKSASSRAASAKSAPAKSGSAKPGAGKTTSATPRSGRGRKSGGAQTTTDHDEIRSWAEAHGGRPAAVARTHSEGDVGIIRIMFPDARNSEHGALTEISWEEFFEEFEARDLALLYEPDRLFSKIIGRDTADKRARGDNHAAR